jgi:hypothetical protein
MTDNKDAALKDVLGDEHDVNGLLAAFDLRFP